MVAGGGAGVSVSLSFALRRQIVKPLLERELQEIRLGLKKQIKDSVKLGAYLDQVIALLTTTLDQTRAAVARGLDPPLAQLLEARPGFRQLGELVGGIRQDHATAGIDHRPLGLGQHLASAGRATSGDSERPHPEQRVEVSNTPGGLHLDVRGRVPSHQLEVLERRAAGIRILHVHERPASTRELVEGLRAVAHDRIFSEAVGAIHALYQMVQEQAARIQALEEQAALAPAPPPPITSTSQNAPRWAKRSGSAL